jgi:hypothetical protein
MTGATGGRSTVAACGVETSVLCCCCLPTLDPFADRLGESRLDVAGEGLPLPESPVVVLGTPTEGSRDKPGFRALLAMGLLAWLLDRECPVAFEPPTTRCWEGGCIPSVGFEVITYVGSDMFRGCAEQFEEVLATGRLGVCRSFGEHATGTVWMRTLGDLIRNEAAVQVQSLFLAEEERCNYLIHTRRWRDRAGNSR